MKTTERVSEGKKRERKNKIEWLFSIRKEVFR